MSFMLTVLGAGTPYPRPGNACSGYLLTAGTARIWVDAGPGTLANLQSLTPIEDLTAVWVSHLHADHCADLLALSYALAFGGLGDLPPVPVFAPAGWTRRIAGFLDRPDSDFLRSVFDVNELTDGETVRFGQLALYSRLVHHDVESYGLRATYQGDTLAYSGDTGPCPALDDLARGVGTLLCESEASAWPPDTPRWHHTPEDTAELAERCGVGRLLVTHVGPTLTAPEAVARIGARWRGPLDTAREGQHHDLRRPRPDPAQHRRR